MCGRRFLHALALAAALTLASIAAAQAEPGYAWRTGTAAPAAADTLSGRIAPPPGFERPIAPPGSFAAWLRGLPLKPEGSPVLLHTGAPKARQDVHVAVIDIDVGSRDLQQCADATMRLRAEWLFAARRTGDIAFNDTGAGKPIAFARWAAGERPLMSGRTLAWSRSARPDAGYASFRRYLDVVFTWAGTYSLERELAPKPVAQLAAGDLFIKGGFPASRLQKTKATGATVHCTFSACGTSRHSVPETPFNATSTEVRSRKTAVSSPGEFDPIALLL